MANAGEWAGNAGEWVRCCEFALGLVQRVDVG